MNIKESITLLPMSKETLINSADLWTNINWSKIIRRVNKLQFRITKMMKQGKYHLVKRLQYLLKNSFYAKLLAIRKVTSNKGKRTPGIDKQLWKTPISKIKAVLQLNTKKYKASPLRRIFIEKKNGKKRALGIPTMTDRAMQALYALILDPISEYTADKRSFGFRKYRACHDAGQQIFHCLAGKDRAEWGLEGDIKGCFDNISHNWLMSNIPINKKILYQFLKSGFIFEKKLFPTHEGTPQGGIISPILANITLDGIEGMLIKEYWKSKTGIIHRRHNRYKVNFIRYADDFVVTSSSKEIAVKIKEKIKQFLIERGLELSESKTKITHVKDGFNFLGWNIRKRKEKLIIQPSKASYKSISEKIRTIIKKQKTITQDSLIKIINPIIRGWCNYHSTMVSKKIYKNLDTVIFSALWKWARRRHSTKPRHWIKDKYWKRLGNRDWVFHGEKERLIHASDTKIKRHRMINIEKNPYSKDDQVYYIVKRKHAKIKKSLKSSFA